MTNEDGMPETIDLDKVLKDIGHFGRYQIGVFAYLVLNVMSNSIKNNQYVFAAAPVKYRCKVPQCEMSPAEYDPGPWATFALPVNSDCYRYRPTGTGCDAASFSNKTEPCFAWVYQNDYTISTYFNLACQEWKRTLVGTMRSLAYFFTMPIVSFFSDTFGRRYVLIGTAVLPAFFGISRVFSTSYVMYVALEFVEAFIGSGAYSTIFILALEMMNLKNRVIGGSMLSCTYAIALSMLGVLAYLIPYWIPRTWAIYAPGILFIAYIWIAEESVRWLITKGRLKEAAHSILKVARVNDRRLSVNTETILNYFATEETVKPNKDPQLEPKFSATSLKKVPLYKQVLRSRIIMCRIVVVSFWWITITMVYYGLTINSVSLAGNNYLNFILTSLIEIPGYLLSLITLDRFGRKTSIMTALLITGVSLLVIGAVNNNTVIMVLTLMGKLCTSMTFCSIYIYTIELFPTQARHQLMGICSMVGRFGSMIAPQTPLLIAYMESLPYILFGAMSTIAGLLMLLTPETLKLKLPDTIEEAENMDIIPRTTRQVDILRDSEVIIK